MANCFLVAGVGAGRRAQRHHSRHEASLRVRFAGRQQLVHLIGTGEVVPRLWCQRIFQHGLFLLMLA